MSAETARKIVGRLLTAFLMVSVGVAIGKELAARGDAGRAEGTRVVVYYMHGEPCPNCKAVERIAEGVVREDFAEAVGAGRAEFRPVNYLAPSNAALARRYKVGGNMVVAVRFEAGREVARIRLDETLELAPEPEKLRDYLRHGIRSLLEGADQ